MLSPYRLSCIFRSGDLPYRRRLLAQYWVVMTVKDDPVRCVKLYESLLRHGGTDHAATSFRLLLEQARERPFGLWWHMVLMTRVTLPLPA